MLVLVLITTSVSIIVASLPKIELDASPAINLDEFSNSRIFVNFCLSSNQFQFMFMEKEWSSVEECLKYVLETEKKVDDVDFVFLEGIIKERINQNEDLQVYLRNTNLRPVITYESSQKSKKICEILSKIRLSLLIF